MNILGCAGLPQLDKCIRRSYKELLGNAGTEVAVVDRVEVALECLSPLSGVAAKELLRGFASVLDIHVIRSILCFC